MNSIPSEAVEAAAQAFYVAENGAWISGHGVAEGGTPWGTSREASLRDDYHSSAVAALTAALPHLRAHIIRELTEEARRERAARTYWSGSLPQFAATWLETRLDKEQS